MRLALLVVMLTSLTAPVSAAEWTHWRGPEQTGFSREKNLPDEWSPNTPGKNNLIWKQPFGCRSTPMVMNGRVYIISALGETPKVPTSEEKLVTGEQVVCFDALKGTLLWDSKFNVFHTDIVTNRLGWSPIAGDSANDRLFAHSTSGYLYAFDGKTGKILWERQLTEEFGRVSGYGGRIGGGPIFDSGLAIVGIVNSSWGDQTRGANRWAAFDGATGKIVWWSEAPGVNKGTYYSNPVVAVINGERLLITGGSDGALHALQVRTGKLVWSYYFSAGVINGSPLVDGNLIYSHHGEENLEGASLGLGRVVCIDAGTLKDGKPTLKWEFRKGIRFGLASAALAEGRLYVPDDAAKLYCFNAKTGKQLWKYNYGTTSRGAPLIADGKLYITETNYKFHIIKLKGDEEPDENETHTTSFRSKPGASGFVEVNCTPSVVDGKIYLATRDDLYCIGSKDAKVESDPLPKDAVETPVTADEKIAWLQIFPADVTVAPGEKVTFGLKAFNAKGQLLANAKPEAKWSLPLPPLPKGAANQPPALDAVIDPATGALEINPKKPSQQGYVAVTADGVTGRARVRVVAQIPYRQNFEMVPVGAVPGGWVNAGGKFLVAEEMVDGKPNRVLRKVNNDARPPFARANAYITAPDVTNYTIEADIKGVEIRERFPDAGVVAGRYTFTLDGKTDEKGQREIRLGSWDTLPRISVAAPFTWQSGVWYRLKMSLEVGEKEAVIRCKVWDRSAKEPEKWNIEFKDPMPNKIGAAALYGYVTNATNDAAGSEIYYDNIVITPNAKK